MGGLSLGNVCGAISKIALSEDQILTMMNASSYPYAQSPRCEAVCTEVVNITMWASDDRIGNVVQSNCCKRNGKIVVADICLYNKKELLELLQIDDCLSDVELVLIAYETWGFDFPNYLNGDFAVAIYDTDQNSLYCARDRFAAKPFYYYVGTETVVFASELKSIMACNLFEKKINTSCLSQYLFNGYIHFPDTIFENVFKLSAGEYLVWSKTGIQTKRYYSLEQKYFEAQNYLIKNYDEAKQQLESLLLDSIQRRIVSSEEVGTFLSGGIDSTLMTALIQSKMQEPLKTFSIGFHDPLYDESCFACETAKYLKTNHTEFLIAESDVLTMIDNIPYFYDEPYGDSSQVPTLFACELAKKHGIDQVITGDGSDEQFCGYDAYKRVALSKKVDPIAGVAGEVLGFLHLKSFLPQKAYKLVTNRDVRTKVQFRKTLTPLLDPEKIFIAPTTSYKFPIEDRFPLDNWMMRAMLVDQNTYVPGTIIKVERGAASVGLSTRSPFCDYRITELAYRFPFEFLYKDGVKKRILKDILYQYVPSEMMDRPKKGFSIPEDRWLKTILRDRLLRLTSTEFLNQQGLFHTQYLHHLVDLYLSNDNRMGYTSSIFWRLLMLQMWYEKYML